MLLANLAKSKEITRLLTLEVAIPKTLPTGGLAITQLFDLFVRGAASKSVTPYNVNTDFDYLSYLFADLAQHASGREYFLTKQSTDDVIPITKVTVFTDHTSDIRRRGVASTLKNVAFEISSHPFLMSEDEANVLPYILLPLMGSEEYSDEDTDGMLMDLQLLAPDKQRDCDLGILKTHIETLMILTTTRPGRIQLRDIKVYPIIRELHLAVEDDEVREACDRLVQVLMADEEDEAAKDEQTKSDARMIAQADPVKEVDSDDDDKIVEV